MSFGYCESFEGETFCFITHSVQNPIVWQDPLVFLPASISASQSAAAVTGTDTITWAGTPLKNAAGQELASGTLSLVSGSGTTVLATGLSGSFALDTANYMDGTYSVVFTETAPGAASTVRSVALYADNQLASLTALVTTLNGELTSDQSTISWLQSHLSASNASLASLESQLASAQAQVTSLEAQVAALQSTNGMDSAALASLQTDLWADANQITSLQGQVAQLQSELNSNKGAAPAWYAAFPGGAIGVAVVFAAIGAIVSGVGVGLRSRRRTTPESPARDPSPAPGESPMARTSPGVDPPQSSRLSPVDLNRRPWGARATPPAPERTVASPELDHLPDAPEGGPPQRSEPNTMYR